MKLSENGKALRWMFIVALSIRLLVSIVMFREHLDPTQGHWNFGWEMGLVARSIYEGHGFSSPLFDPSGPTAWMAPVYPYLIAGCMKLFGLYTAASALAILSLNSIFASITVLPVFFTARRIFGERTARLAGWMWVFFPYSIYLSAGRIWENTLTCMVASFIWLQTLRLVESRKNRDWILWGALWGAAALVSPAALGTLPFLGIWVVVRRHKAQRSWLLPAVASALVFVACIAPWTIRNYQTFHRFIPLRDNFWLEMHVGNNGDTSDVTPDSSHPSNNPAEYAQWKQLGELGYMDAKKVETKAFIREHPGFFAWVSLRRAAYVWTGFWSLDPKFLAGEPFHIPNVMFTTAITLLMLRGLRYARRRGKREAVLPIILVLITFPVVYYVSHPSMDYRHPLDPLIVSAVCYCVVEWLREREEKKAALAVETASAKI